MPNERQYELVYIVAPTAGDTELEALQGELNEHIETLGGAVESTDLWGRRKLAYAIGPFTEGIYINQLISGPAEMISELERRLRVRDQVLRYLTVRVDEDLRKARLAAEKRKAAAASREPGPAPSAAGETPVAAVESDTPSSDDKTAAAAPDEPGSAPSAAGETPVAAVESDTPSSDDKSNDTGPASETPEVQE